MARIRIALLEDDAPLRDVLLDALAELDRDIEVIGCSSHRELLDVLAEGTVDGVIADAWGPSQSVLTDAERQAIVELGRTLPLVLLTGRSWSMTADAADLSAIDIIQKPFELDALAAIVRRLAERALEPSGRTGPGDAPPSG